MADFKVVNSGDYLLKCTPLHTIFIDGGMPLHANIYGAEWGWSAVYLEAGTHTVSSRVRFRGQVVFSCLIRSSTGTLQFHTLLFV